MSTTATLPFKRFIRRTNSGQITNTQWLGAMASVSELIKYAPWVETAIKVAVLPVNVPTTADFSSGTFDCFKQSGNAQNNTGTQCVFGGMSIYRLSIPASASSTFISSVSFRASSDKFCVGGLKIAAILSDSATPPTDWNILRNGGAGSVIDTESAFSTLGTMEELTETAGILADTSLTVSGSNSHAGAFELDLSSVTTAYKYLYLAVSLFDYQTYRREYWVEGSGAIEGESIAVTFDGDVTIEPYVVTILEPFDFDKSIPLNQGFWNNNSTVNNQIQNSYDYLLESSIDSDLVASDFVNLALAAREYAGVYQGIAEISDEQSLPQIYNGVLPSPLSLPVIGYRRVLSDLNGGQKLYRHFVSGAFFARGGYICEFGSQASGISFENGIEAIEDSILEFRLSLYALSGIIPYASFSSDGSEGLTCNCISRASGFDSTLITGTATSFSLGYTDRRGQSLLASSIIRRDSEFLYDTKTVTVSPLGYIDIQAADGLAAGTMIPFSSKIILQRHQVFFVNIAVIRVASSTVSDLDQSVSFNPGKFFIHKA